MPIGAVWTDMTAANLGVGNLPGPVGGIQYTTPAPNELLFRSLTLTLTPMVGGGAGTFTVGFVTDLDLQPFSNTNLPSTQTTITVYSAAHTFVVGTTVTFPINLGVNELQTGNFVGGMETANAGLCHSGFQGVIGLVLTFTGAVTTFHSYLAPSVVALRPTFIGDETPYLTGLLSNKPMMSRADYCPRCGQPTFREYLTEDGYTKTLVCSDCWDPAERRERRRKPGKQINP
jgi:hypothetical protein